MEKFKNVDEYINSFPLEIQEILKNFRKLVRENAIEAKEELVYGMVGYKLCGKPLVYFGAFKSHLGFYATPTGHEQFKEALSIYKQGKGSVQFPFDRPIPYDLVKEIVEFRVEENSKYKK